MIRSSACPLRQTDPFPARAGKHGNRRSYTTSGDSIYSTLTFHYIEDFGRLVSTIYDALGRIDIQDSQIS